jgi:carbamoyltransferase
VQSDENKPLHGERILGIGDGMTGGVALIEGDRVVGTVSEERITRRKMAIGFPNAALTEVLRSQHLSPKDIDLVMVATREGYFRADSHAYEGWFPEARGTEGTVPRRKTWIINVASSKLARPVFQNRPLRWLAYRMRGALLSARRAKVRQLLRDKWGFTCPIRFVHHHFAHATGAYYTCGLRDALVVTIDGAGDGDSAHVYAVRGGDFKLLQRIDSYDSIGNFYGYVTHICGFVAHKHEGKITGLAAIGEPRFADLFHSLITYRNGRIVNCGSVFFREAIRRITSLLPDGYEDKDVASSIQQVLEEVVTQYVSRWVGKTGLHDLALSGGVFANVRLNQKLHELDNVGSVFIHPGMGDEGLALGAAFAGWRDCAAAAGRRYDWPPVADVYLGPEYSPDDMADALTAEGVDYHTSGDVAAEVAQHLAAGRVVARFDGRMEYGPRALGNRSILYQATDPSVNDWLNQRLQRTEFMPFAPVTRIEDAMRLYQNVHGAAHTAEFMTITFDCSDELKRACPAVVHVDGTARPQLLRQQTNPVYYRILDEYIRLTGNPALINTSFNMHEEPIVCSPVDALRAFLQGHLDVLSMGPFIALAPEGAARAEVGSEHLRA